MKQKGVKSNPCRLDRETGLALLHAYLKDKYTMDELRAMYRLFDVKEKGIPRR